MLEQLYELCWISSSHEVVMGHDWNWAPKQSFVTLESKHCYSRDRFQTSSYRFVLNKAWSISWWLIEQVMCQFRKVIHDHSWKSLGTWQKKKWKHSMRDHSLGVGNLTGNGQKCWHYQLRLVHVLEGLVGNHRHGWNSKHWHWNTCVWSSTA